MKHSTMTRKEQHIQGVWTAALTPLHADLSPDTDLLLEHCHRLLASGCNGVVLLGTTGEANSFSLKERMQIVNAVGQADIASEKCIIGTGCCSFSDTMELSQYALDRGFHQLLILPPFYYKEIQQDGLLEYFNLLLNKIRTPELKILYYHFPKLTGITISKEFISKLNGKYPHNFIGIKDSSGDWAHMQELCHSFPGFQIFAGSEEFLLSIMKNGGAGCISATTNITGTLAVEVYKKWQGSEGKVLQEKLTGIRKAIAGFPLIPALKTIMAVIHNDNRWLTLRPPHVLLTQDEQLKLLAVMKTVGIGQNLF